MVIQWNINEAMRMNKEQLRNMGDYHKYGLKYPDG